jgi:hypothetical protein
MSLLKSTVLVLAFVLFGSGCASSLESSKKTRDWGTPTGDLGPIREADSPRNNDQEARAREPVERPRPVERERYYTNTGPCWACR